MKLGLAIKGIDKDKNGLDAIGMKNLVIVDLDTGEELEERVGMLWGDKTLLTESGEPLLTEEHFQNYPDDAEYLVLVIRCDSAIHMDNS